MNTLWLMANWYHLRGFFAALRMTTSKGGGREGCGGFFNINELSALSYPQLSANGYQPADGAWWRRPEKDLETG